MSADPIVIQKLPYPESIRTPPPLGVVVIIEGREYVTCDREPVEGDLVLPINETRAWLFKPAPCTMPWWGNRHNCRVLIPVEDSTDA